jgi:tRNA (guanine37-N1)-methyltransferase
MRFDIVTLFPEIFTGYLGQGLLKRAIDRGLVEVRLHNLRDWATDKHRSVDDRPFGGGPGMVIRVDVAVACVEAVRRLDPEPGHLVMLTPQGRRLRQAVVEELAAKRRMILVCGRYEGFDERIRQVLQPDEVSLGDFVLNGGEVAAMAVIDASIRLVPGVLGDEESSQTDSFSGAERLLEFAQYTRPREFRGLEVPPILLGGDHQAIARWREQNRTLRTRQRRADLLENQIPKERENHEPRTAEAGREEQLEG